MGPKKRQLSLNLQLFDYALHSKFLVRDRCYVSVNSKANPQGMFLKGRIPHSTGTKEVQNSDPWGRKIVLKPHPRGNYFQNFSKKTTKHETEVMKNSTEMLICLEILKH